ncbi:postacrosomal sheath WW domain-binding protein isoform X3 [Rattus norvegicus]|uniref:postacrosomal sheath WW domain-binding protein isoform X3 n=1 Tax=Rattus norvegicus TaxID=10116 RepID=UPI0019176887|nr:postacrosomal sheath WW domain-binding protein isoform X5 [Rattus norvegicus]
MWSIVTNAVLSQAFLQNPPEILFPGCFSLGHYFSTFTAKIGDSSTGAQEEWHSQSLKKPTSSVLKKCSDVDLSFPQPRPGSNLFSGTKRGTVFLTSYRVIFVTSRSDNDPMLSFMMPFHLMNNCTIEQPIFGANYIKGTIQAAPDGGWEGSATFKIVFRKGGAIDFAQLMAKAASAAAQGVPLRVASFWMGPLGIYVITGERNIYAPQAYQAAYGAPHAGYGVPPAGYGVPPAGYGVPPAGYGVLPAGH